MEEKKETLTPSEFYRKRRPEYFSDSEKSYEIKLPKEHFAYELSMISTNQKQDAFETLCRRLAEKLIAPNLIPQVGPTGGGDGKTDFETYPVSEQIAERWFVPENGWQKDENWAFAISAKEDWSSKVRSDVKKIFDTGRGYTRIYFITNQVISSKKKKNIQDELKKDYKVDIVILDGTWITEKIYDNDLIGLAVDSLSLSSVYKNEIVKVGKNDAARIERLQEIERNISDTNRYFEYDYQLVEDALEAAILIRMLEKPKDVVIAAFDRALKLGQKIKNKQQIARTYYQRAWTHVQWYDDYNNFFSDFENFKKFAVEDINLNNLELYFNLINVLRSISFQEEDISDIDFEKEENEFYSLLDVLIKNTAKPTTSLTARTYKSFLNLFHLTMNKEEVSVELKLLMACFQEGTQFLEYPFESFKEILDVFGNILPNNTDFDNLIDCVAEIYERRVSELVSGETFLNRGFQKLTNGFSKESIIYFGKSVQKLAKEETQEYFYFALRGLCGAYRNMGLLWASNNCNLAACSISIKEWYYEGRLSKKLYRCLEEALKNELFIGRVPHLLCWHELFKVVRLQFRDDEEHDEGELPTIEMTDACLAVRLLNSSYNTWKSFSFLPDILEREELWLSQDAALYILGHSDLIEQEHLNKGSTSSTIDEYYNLIANQPFKSQIIYDTNLLETHTIQFKSIILGTEFFVKFDNNKDLAILAEAILAYLESFWATSFSDAYTATEKITISLKIDEIINGYTIVEFNSDKLYEIIISSSIDHTRLQNMLFELNAKILSKNFIIKDAQQYLQKLFERDEVHQRLSLITSHKIFFDNIFGKTPKIFLADWRFDSMKDYSFNRIANPIQINNGINEKGNSDFETNTEKIKHNQTKVSSIIDNHLWDGAHWGAFGFFTAEDIPLGIFLAFEDERYGRQIFEDWINRFGQIDEQDVIKISIIKGINTDEPQWYKVHVTKRMDKDSMKEGQYWVSASRFHKMTPNNSKNLTNLIALFNYYKKYVLLPATLKEDGAILPHLDLAILKTELTIKDAWEISEHDLDSVVINKDDKPIIPPDNTNPPILGVLKRIEES